MLAYSRRSPVRQIFKKNTVSCLYTTTNSTKDIPCTSGKDCPCAKCRAARIKKRRVFPPLSDMECSGGLDCQCSVCKAARISRQRQQNIFYKYSLITECNYRVDCPCAKCKALRAVKQLARAVGAAFITECTSTCTPGCRCPKCKATREAKSFALTVCSGDAYCQCTECKANRTVHAVAIRSREPPRRALSGSSGGKNGCTGRSDCPCPKCTAAREEQCARDQDSAKEASEEDNTEAEYKCTGRDDCACPRCKAMRASGLLCANSCTMVSRSDCANNVQEKDIDPCASRGGQSAKEKPTCPAPGEDPDEFRPKVCGEDAKKLAEKPKDAPPPKQAPTNESELTCKKAKRKKKIIPEDFGYDDDDGDPVEPKREQLIHCTLIPGDGVGPEVSDALQLIFEVAKVPVKFDVCILSEVHKKAMKFEDVISSIKKHKVAIMGNLAKLPSYTPRSGSLQTLKTRFRHALDLFVNVVHVRSLPNVVTRHKDIDTIIIREQTEGEYSAIERECVPGVVESLKIITAKKSQRIAKFAFDFATRNNRSTITAVHKANIMKLGDGLFLASCTEMAKLYPKIKYNAMIVDNTTMQLVSNPKQFDVMVTPNLYGNLIDNLCAGLVGGAGVVSGISYSPDVAIFEAGSHHTFEAGVGKNIANPTAILLCGAAMLSHVHLATYAEKIKYAIYKVLRDGKVRTRDLGGKSSTTDFVREIARNIN